MRGPRRPPRNHPKAAAARRPCGLLRARLASLLGVVPLGVWTSRTSGTTSRRSRGRDAWQSAVTEYPHPFAEALTGVIVLLPIAIHAVWGIGRLVSSRPNNVRYGFYANLKYLLQRLERARLLLFLGAHLWRALLQPRLVEGHAETFADIAQEMHFNTPTLVVYVLGTLAVSYHLANGAQTFCMGWGVVRASAGLRRLEGAALALFFSCS